MPTREPSLEASRAARGLVQRATARAAWIHEPSVAASANVKDALLDIHAANAAGAATIQEAMSEAAEEACNLLTSLVAGVKGVSQACRAHGNPASAVPEAKLAAWQVAKQLFQSWLAIVAASLRPLFVIAPAFMAQQAARSGSGSMASSRKDPLPDRGTPAVQAGKRPTKDLQWLSEAGKAAQEAAKQPRVTPAVPPATPLLAARAARVKAEAAMRDIRAKAAATPTASPSVAAFSSAPAAAQAVPAAAEKQPRLSFASAAVDVLDSRFSGRLHKASCTLTPSAMTIVCFSAVLAAKAAAH
ncbi:hypothetical protein WJX72_000909 [[Myrmecia] bisecta]|uniref:Uncharacterized protein n=1 Tax=[Myrmecia] bisecta TaxID=41462 RepID=A0AAW1QNU7_9CHLO